jgi:hypothetical protein
MFFRWVLTVLVETNSAYATSALVRLAPAWISCCAGEGGRLVRSTGRAEQQRSCTEVETEPADGKEDVRGSIPLSDSKGSWRKDADPVGGMITVRTGRVE